jgi:hypothetical protein
MHGGIAQASSGYGRGGLAAADLAGAELLPQGEPRHSQSGGLQAPAQSLCCAEPQAGTLSAEEMGTC